MNAWKIARIGLITICGVSALFSTQAVRASGMDWTGVLVAFFAFPVIAAVGGAMLLLLPKSHLRVSRPDWNHSFIDFSQPEQFFHLGALLLLVSGLVLAGRSIAALGDLPPVNVAPIAMGLGVLFALRVLAFLSEASA
jgi:hypothetical protein